MTVDITVNWKFVGEDADDVAELSFATHRVDAENGHDDARDEELSEALAEVVPLGSSVLARGLSLPLPI